MKKVFTPLVFKATLLSLFAAFISLSTFSQCPGYYSVATVTPPCGSYATRTFNPGGYLLTNVVTGAQYQFTTCSTSNYDTRIYIYNSAGTTYYADNDDACNNASGSYRASDLTWISTFSGQARVSNVVYGCPGSPGYGWFSGMTSAVLSYRQVNNISSPTPTSSAGNTICVNTATTLTASPSAGSGASFSYKWYKNGALQSGQTASTYTLAANSLSAGTNTFYYTATLGQCSTTSGTLTITVDAIPTAGSYAYTTLYECDGYTRNGSGTIVTNSVSSYSGTATWYWGTSGGAVNSWGTGSNAPGNNCFPYQHGSGDADRMWVVVKSANGACPSVTMPKVLVVPTAPAISNVTAAANPVCGQGTTTLTANGVSGLAATVTWYTGSGATGNNLGTGTTLAAGGAQTYYARVTDVCNATTQCSGTKSSAVEANITIALESTAPVTTAPATASVYSSPNNACKAAGLLSNGTISDACTTGASVGINPLPSSGLMLWTRADAGVVKDGSGKVAQWKDLSGNGNHFTQSNFSNRPTLTASNSSFNNNPSLTFTTAQYLTNITNIGSGGTGAYTMFTVSRMSGGSNSRLISSASTNWLLGYWGGYQNQHYANGWISNPATTPTTTAHIYSVASSGNGANATTFYDYGNVIATGTAGAPNTPGVIQLNGWSNGLNEMSNGEIAEVIYYNRVLSTAERQIIEGYLAYKYNIQAPLASMQAFQTFVTGNTTINFKGADAAGNTSTASQTITGVTYPGPAVNASSTSLCVTSNLSLTTSGMAPAGQSAKCANSGDYLNVTSVPVGSNWTIMAWVKFPLPNTGGAGSWNTFVRGTAYHHIICNNDGTNKYLGTYVGGFQSSGFSVNQLSAGWHHIAAVGSGGGTGFYVDGIFVGRSASQPTDNLVAIGNYQGGGQQFGQFDEVSVWNTALPQNTISNWMTRGLTASHPNWANLVAYYKLNNNGADSKAGTYPATQSGSATWNTNTAFYTYTWSGPGGTFSANNTTAESTTVSSPASGTYSVYASANSCNSQTTNSAAIVVDQQPVISGSSAVCDNSTGVTYTNTTGSTAWSVSPVTLGSITTGGVFTPTNLNAPTANATGNIVVTNGNCTANYPVQVDNKYNITSSAADMCEGATRALTADISGGSFTADCGACVSGTTFTAPTPSSNSAYSTITYLISGNVCPSAKQDILVWHTPSTANAGTDVTTTCGSALTMAGATPAFGTGTWTQTAGPGSSTFANSSNATTTVTATSQGTYTYRWTVSNGVCPSNHDDANGDYISNVAPTALVDECMNSAGTDNYYVLLTATGGNGTYTFSGSPVTNLSGTQRIYEQAAGSTQSYTVTDGLGCWGTTNATAPNGHPADIPYASAPGTVTVDCYQKNLNKWVTYRNSSNEAVLSIQDNNQDLGAVTVTVYRDGVEPVALSNNTASTCTGFDDLKALERHFRITSSAAQPFASNVGVRLYFSNAELNSLITASNGNNVPGDLCTGNDDVTSINDLYVTKYSGPLEDNDYNNNDASGIYKVYGNNGAYANTDGPLTKSPGGFATLFSGAQSHHYVELNVDRFSEFWLHGSQPAQALPVEMIYFEANAVDNSFIELKWATAIEINNDGFWVERSTDGINFNQIAWVDGHDNSTVTITYKYNDMDASTGTRYYYRLKQMDNDGQFEYTAVVSAILTGGITFEVLDFVPNPTANQTNLLITSNVSQEVRVELYNLIGERMLDRNVLLNKGGNNVPFNLNALASGTYTALVHTGNEVHTRKVVVTK